MGKKGQFFLIAAIIIAGVIITLGTVYVATKTTYQEKTKVYDLSGEIDFESNRVIDYGIFKGVSIDEKNKSLTEIMDYYQKSNPGVELTMIYYVPGMAKPLSYKFGESAGSAATNFGTTTGPGVNVQSTLLRNLPSEVFRDTKKINVTLERGAPAQEFNLTEGENFYIVLKEEVGGEQFVAQK